MWSMLVGEKSISGVVGFRGDILNDIQKSAFDPYLSEWFKETSETYYIMHLYPRQEVLDYCVLWLIG